MTVYSSQMSLLTDLLDDLGFGSKITAEKIGWRGLGASTRDHYQCEFCGQENLDCTLIKHDPGCPVLTARAAVFERIPPPSAVYRPAIYIDGNKWCALYGADLMAGVAGFGDSPAEAMAEFDKAWVTTLQPKG